jgi:7,8-dihydro-6-hydroxymethylpterin-pyrophosphokinase
MHERDFVLKPLCEIAPDIIHPVLKKKICDLMQEIKNPK